MRCESIRVRGLVQGVGFRPTVWRLALECGLRGDVRNDSAGVLIRAVGAANQIEQFCTLLRRQCPPLGRIDALERADCVQVPEWPDFRIVASEGGEVHTGVVADAATCEACRSEIFDPADRRSRYPFTNCTHCGPRLSIVRAIPYDRGNTSMDRFPMCPECRCEYEDPADRRFHAQPNACPVCGPRVVLLDRDGTPLHHPEQDGVAAASRLLATGHIVAIKGIGGFHLACDARDAGAVAELRSRKRRYRKPFALMARDIEIVRACCACDAEEAALLESPAAPVVLLARSDTGMQVAAAVAPGQTTLGFMLPYSPLHHLLLADWDGPLVMTSGNLSDEPQCTANTEATQRLQGLADFYLVHDREIINRVDDSVVRVMAGSPRVLRRARGYAPTPLGLPPGFERVPPVLALGGELKNTFCLLKDGQAIVSQHLGDLEDARTADDFEGAVALYRALFQHRPELIAVDLHPDYRSTRFGRTLAGREGLDLVTVQHHFGHIAGVLADAGHPLDADPVIGVALDGLGYGGDGTIWGGEFLLADYRGYSRLAHLAAVPLPGGGRAILEPWRNLYAQLSVHLGMAEFLGDFGDLELAVYLRQKPLDRFATMLEKGINSPMSSSCGRLFDAVAAALGVCRDGIHYEGQAAIELEALVAPGELTPERAYPFAIDDASLPWRLDPAPMWRALLEDLKRAVPGPSIAARFHSGLAAAVAGLAIRLAREKAVGTVALSGGVMQNKTFFEALSRDLDTAGLKVLSHRRVPTNDGGLSLGQAVIAAVRRMDRDNRVAP